MNAEFDSILEQCLSQIMAGKARVESCLLSYPALADELEPLLRSAEWLRAVPKPELSPDTATQIQARVFQEVKVRRRWRLPTLKFGAVSPPRRRAVVVACALVALVLLATFSLAATSRTLPGSVAYPLKLATEKAWLWLAPAADQPEIHLRLAQRRLEEVEALALQGDFDPSILNGMTGATQAALQSIRDLQPADALALLDQFLALTDSEREVLSDLSGRLPFASQPGWAAALSAIRKQADRARWLMSARQPWEPPGQTRTPQPPGQTRTPQPPGQTRTPQPPGQTGKPERPGQTRTPEPPGQTRTPEPPGQTRTPEPPGRTRTPEPPGQNKTVEPPEQAGTPAAPIWTETPAPPVPTDTPLPPGQSKPPKDRKRNKTP
jgi:hypothetical protein